MDPPPPRPAFPRAAISFYSEPSHWTVVLTHAPLVLVSTTILGQPMRKYDFRLSRQSLWGQAFRSGSKLYVPFRSRIHTALPWEPITPYYASQRTTCLL